MTSTALSKGFIQHLQQHWPLPSPLTDCTLVSACFTEQTVSPELFSHYGVTVPAGSTKRQAEFLAARLCAREALRVQTGRAQLPSQHDNSRIPRWPAHSCGSMSHSHGICAAVVGSTQHWQSLGLDIEKPLAIQRAQRVAKAVLTAEEYRTYQNLDSSLQAGYVTRVFSLKESLFKALNPLTGTFFGFQDAQVVTISTAETGQAHLQLLKNLSAAWPAGSQLLGQFSQLHGCTLSLVGVAAAGTQ